MPRKSDEKGPSRASKAPSKAKKKAGAAAAASSSSSSASPREAGHQPAAASPLLSPGGEKPPAGGGAAAGGGGGGILVNRDSSSPSSANRGRAWSIGSRSVGSVGSNRAAAPVTAKFRWVELSQPLLLGKGALPLL